MAHPNTSSATTAEAMTHAVSGDEAMQTRRERQIAGRLLIGVVLAAVLVVLFGLPALTMVGLVATVLVFVVLIAYATGY
ncbi:hypothetical protein [Paracoccus sanguinis]|uniref:Uncharacterized protein n=1 Tax=Paracoccus sanguinis TaxID=1545044 RepID=A0A099GLQ5_9RHOB|nr:hypothetical protein [Paracoccus sanguinis]KGJ23661.1 hypothetical protein IX56_00780 [Paracoccus sanguinis]